MLRLRLISNVALAALALCTAAPALAQQGTGDRIEAAERKLDADIKACKPVDPAEYKSLLDEANRNLKTAEKGKASGFPVDIDKMQAEWKKASDLYKRALSAPKPCPPPQKAPEPK